MALTLNDASNVKKAPTGPNPQSRLGMLAAGAGAGATVVPAAQAQNQGVAAAGAQAGANTGQAAQPTPIGAKVTYDYSTDPILQLTNAASQLAISQAQSAALAQKQQALIAFGDPNLALAVTGDKNTAAAAAGNTASTLATLAAKNQQNVRATNEAENKANLTFSSDRGYQLGLLQQGYLADQASEYGKVQSTLSGANQSVLDATQKATDAEINAQSAAYNRALAHPVGVTQQHMAPTPLQLLHSAASGAGGVKSGASPVNYQARKQL